jgi:ubiquinone/menaquinone biosynthesis C-methylase UbiE
MYSKSHAVYDAIYSWKDYEAETRRLVRMLRGKWRPPGRRLLEVACGTGKYLEHLAKRFDVEGLDIEPGMIRAAHERLPKVKLHLGDMRAFDLGSRFDVVVCLFGSIGYCRSVRELRQAVRRMAEHLEDGGILVVEPWFRASEFHPDTVHSLLSRQPGLHVVRMNTSRRRGRRSVFDFHHLVGTPKGTHHFVEHHELTMFTDAEYRAAFKAAGLAVARDAKGLNGRGLWLSKKPAR